MSVQTTVNLLNIRQSETSLGPGSAASCNPAVMQAPERNHAEHNATMCHIVQCARTLRRWSAASASVLSPASSSDPDTVTSWVGIIMYLPTEEPGLRGAITRRRAAALCLPVAEWRRPDRLLPQTGIAPRIAC